MVAVTRAARHAVYVFTTKHTGCLQIGHKSPSNLSAQRRHAAMCPHGTNTVSMSLSQHILHTLLFVLVFALLLSLLFLASSSLLMLRTTI